MLTKPEHSIAAASLEYLHVSGVVGIVGDNATGGLAVSLSSTWVSSDLNVCIASLDSTWKIVKRSDIMRCMMASHVPFVAAIDNTTCF